MVLSNIQTPIRSSKKQRMPKISCTTPMITMMRVKEEVLETNCLKKCLGSKKLRIRKMKEERCSVLSYLIWQ